MYESGYIALNEGDRVSWSLCSQRFGTTSSEELSADIEMDCREEGLRLLIVGTDDERREVVLRAGERTTVHFTDIAVEISYFRSPAILGEYDVNIACVKKRAVQTGRVGGMEDRPADIPQPATMPSGFYASDGTYTSAINIGGLGGVSTDPQDPWWSIPGPPTSSN